MPQPSVADAVPSAAFTSAGLHPRSVVVYVPVNVGGVLSLVQVTVLEVVALLLQPSTAVNVLVCDLKHPLELTALLLVVKVGAPQASEAVALPSAALMSDAVGLQPSVVGVPFAVIIGIVLSVTVII